MRNALVRWVTYYRPILIRENLKRVECKSSVQSVVVAAAAALARELALCHAAATDPHAKAAPH